MPASDREVFDHFLNDPDTSREVALLAYASFAQDKYAWVEHRETRDGQPPTPQDIDGWIADLPEQRFRAIRDAAVEAFDVAARTYMAPEIEKAGRDALDAAILRRVERATSFWRGFPGNLLVGTVASLVFAALVILFGIVFERDPSPTAIFKHFEEHSQPR
jgi:hypothetical protein